MAGSSKKVIYAALIGNSLIAVTKFVAAGITGSSAMVSEGIHSLVDTGNQCLLLHGLKKAKQPPDAQFPFGHGKEIYFWSFIVAILIFAIGAGVSLYEGVHHLLHPEPLRNAYINYIVLGLAIIFEGFALGFAVIEFRKDKGKLGYLQAVREGKDPTMFVVLFEDLAAMLGLLVALGGIYLGESTGSPYFDGLASVLIGFILALTAVWLAIETKSLLIGESASPAMIDGIRMLAANCPEVDDVNEILTMHMGPDFVLVNISINFADQVEALQLENTIAGLDKAIKQRFPSVKRVFVEAEAQHLLRAASVE